VQKLRTFAAEHRVAVVLVHHLRKADSDDAFDTVSGTLGLTGAPDTILVLKRDANGGIVLHGRGRDLTEIEQAMQFNKDACTWTTLGDAGQFRVETGRGAVLAALAEIGPEATPTDIAAAAHMKPNTVRQLLLRLAKDGMVPRKTYGKYALVA
jgi:DNA-binding transcriptional ArsR family regulator